METASLSLIVAFGAGILSFVSPCVLPLVPAYIGHLAGRAVGTDPTSGERATTLAHALAFVLGFSAIFIILGASVGLAGFLIRDQLPWLRLAGGAVLIVMGLHVAGVLRLPALYREMRLPFRPSGRFGLASSFLVGVIFGAGWTPCIGPILGAILLYASTTQTVGQGALLLTAYSLGLGMPFLGAAWALDRSVQVLRRLNRQAQVVESVSGVLLVVMGLVVMLNLMGRLAAIFPTWIV